MTKAEQQILMSKALKDPILQQYVVDNLISLEKENAELKEQCAKAKAIMNIAVEGIKYWGIVGGTERPFTAQAEKLFNLFLDEVEKFMKEE